MKNVKTAHFKQSEKQGSPERSEGGSYFWQEKQGSLERSEGGSYFWQDNNQIRGMASEEGSIMLPSAEAWGKFPWVKKYFRQKPKEGFFLWVKEPISSPLLTRICISSEKIFQNPRNLIFLAKNAQAEISSACWSTKESLTGKHQAVGKIVLEENSKLLIKEEQRWGEEDVVSVRRNFWIGKGAELSYFFRCLETPGELRTQNNLYLQAGAAVNLISTVFAGRGEVKMKVVILLNGEGAKGIWRSRMVSDQKAKISARSRMIANQAGTGHVDCSGLLLSDQSTIQLIPELLNKNKNASLTHEASVGRISEEVLNYLRTRGLTKDEATDLIITSFLEEEEPVIMENRKLKLESLM